MRVLTAFRASRLTPGGEPVARLDRLDLVGLTLAGALASWTVISGLVKGGNPIPALAVLGVSSGVYLVGRRVAGRSPLAVPSAVAVTGVVFLALSPTGIYSAHPASGPFGYANAKAVISVLAAVAVAMAAIQVGSRRIRATALLLAIALALVPLSSSARTVTVVAIGLPLTGIVALRGGPRRAFLAVCAAVVIAVPIGTAALAITGDAASLGSTLDPRRVRLWEEAADLMVAHPWFGVGPGRFAAESPTGGSDQDARWAHHDFLHQGAESGVLGFIVLLLLFVWALARIATSTAPASIAIPAGFAVASLATIASFDYVLHFPAIAAVGAALVGTAAPLAARGGWSPEASARMLVKVAALPWGVVAHRRPGDVVILLYHRIGVGGREIDVPTDSFDAQMAALAESRDVRPLEEALQDPRGGVVVTFDDGYRDFYEHALPSLVRRRVPAVLYLATGLIDGDPEALTWSQLEEAVSTGLVEVGGHTHGHTDLSRADAVTAGTEMRRCKDLIEERLGQPCRHFAYPWGVGSPAADRVARSLFASAALDAWRTNHRDRIDPHRLGRTPILRGDGPFFFRAKVRGMLDAERVAYRLLRRGPWRR